MLRRLWNALFGKRSPPEEELRAEHRELEAIKIRGTLSRSRARSLERELQAATQAIRRGNR